jgi:hypothetical protein
MNKKEKLRFHNSSSYKFILHSPMTLGINRKENLFLRQHRYLYTRELQNSNQIHIRRPAQTHVRACARTRG